MGFTLSVDVSISAVSSYLTFSPLLFTSGCFLWHFPSGRPAPSLTGTLPVELGLSSDQFIVNCPAVARSSLPNTPILAFDKVLGIHLNLMVGIVLYKQSDRTIFYDDRIYMFSEESLSVVER